jgi:hypothetical protein
MRAKMGRGVAGAESESGLGVLMVFSYFFSERICTYERETFVILSMGTALRFVLSKQILHPPERLLCSSSHSLSRTRLFRGLFPA